MTIISVPAVLRAELDFNEYSDDGAARKEQLHSKGKTLLKAIAAKLGLQPSDYSLRSNRAGIAVSGEVTLHADHLYLQLGDSCMTRGLQLMYRSCSSRTDYSGHRNHFIKVKDLANPASQEAAIATMKRLLETASD